MVKIFLPAQSKTEKSVVVYSEIKQYISRLSIENPDVSFYLSILLSFFLLI